jgi:hypothetical protein
MNEFRQKVLHTKATSKESCIQVWVFSYITSSFGSVGITLNIHFVNKASGNVEIT